MRAGSGGDRAGGIVRIEGGPKDVFEKAGGIVRIGLRDEVVADLDSLADLDSFGDPVAAGDGRRAA